ncbi:MAG: TetR/AcrR family transcriptional regulator [Actinomycetota bacterium]
MKKLGRPTRCDSADTRGRLLIEARRSFAIEGFDATTNKSLAKAAGITTAAIYHYFPSKVELYVAVFSDVQQMVCDTIQKSVDQELEITKNISSMIDALAELTVREPAVVSFVLSVSAEAHRHPELMQAILPTGGRIGRILLQIATEAVVCGEVNDEISAQSLEDMLMVVLAGLARFNMLYRDAKRTAALINAMKILMAGAAFKVSVDA